MSRYGVGRQHRRERVPGHRDVAHQQGAVEHRASAREPFLIVKERRAGAMNGERLRVP
jgi:hypothetical protein